MKHICLECSLKPFNDKNTVLDTCRMLLSRWAALLEDAEVVKIMLWTADGSEILDYTGDMNKTFEWSKYIGSANPIQYPWDRDLVHMACKNMVYRQDARDFTYADLKEVVQSFKQAGAEMFPGKIIKVGETFDIGPEFAVSEFKYKRHREICKGDMSGNNDKMFIDSFGILAGDDYPYAAYPNGIPDGLEFSEFLGAQSQIFLADIGFDYLWLSNGVGFSAMPWNSHGDVYDGKEFHTDALPKVKENLIKFWQGFRRKCNYPLEVRGTNFSAGIDYATDGVPLSELYHAGFDFLPAPNSPWAALDYDFGLEFMGHMTRIADVPDSSYLFRYYIHDPWWPNSPWDVRYEGQPHDIYMPLAIARIDENGNVVAPDHLNILSIDNVYGKSPANCANEPTAHLLKAMSILPDKPSPLVWVYPVSEYTTSETEQQLCDMFANDWFVRNLINTGFPLSNVVSTNNFIKHNKDIYCESVLVSCVPRADSKYETAIIEYVKKGGKVLFFGSTRAASEKFKAFVNVKNAREGVEGELPIQGAMLDTFADGRYPKTMRYSSKLNGGMLTEQLMNNDGDVKAVVKSGDYVIATAGENFVWTRAVLGGEFRGARLLGLYKESESILNEVITRKLLKYFGIQVDFEKFQADRKTPVLMIHRHDNAFMFSNFNLSATIDTVLSMPDGAPIFNTCEAIISNNTAKYRFAMAQSQECRIFVKQNDGVVDCHIHHSDNVFLSGHLTLRGLENAEITYYSPEHCKKHVYFTGNPRSEHEPYYGTTALECERVGCKYTIKNFTGTLEIFTPDKDTPKDMLEFFDNRNWMR